MTDDSSLIIGKVRDRHLTIKKACCKSIFAKKKHWICGGAVNPLRRISTNIFQG